MTIALLTPRLSDAAGGLATAVPQLARALARTGPYAAHLLGGLCSGERLSAECLDVNEVHPRLIHGPAVFAWMPELPGTLDRLTPALVHTHGLWTYASVAGLSWSKRTEKPFIVSPHGMLDPWAVRRSQLKKAVASWWFEAEHLRRAACLHALNEAEAAAFRACGLSNPICILPNGVDLPLLDQLGPPVAGPGILLFLGRLHEKKGIAELLAAWALVTPEVRRLGFKLQLTGWGDAGYVARLRRMIDDRGLHDSVSMTGPLFGSEKDAAYRAASAFILPSFSEGLPMSVLEACSYALPVIITPQCNIPEAASAGAAIMIEAEPGSIAAGLRRFFKATDAERQALGRAARRLVERQFTWPEVGRQMWAVYGWVLGGGERPSVVVV